MEANEFTLMQKLINCASNNSGDNVFGDIAYFLLLHFNNIDGLTVPDLADACFTSQSTIRRFCNSLGYNSLKHLKIAKAGNPESQMEIAINNAQEKRFSAKYMQLQINSLLYDIARSVDRIQLDTIMSIVMNNQNLLLLAIRPYALWLKEFQSQMLFIGKPTYIVDDLENYEKLFQRIEKNYSCIVVSPTGGIAGTVSRHIGSLNCRKVLIICKEYYSSEILGDSFQVYDHVLKLKINNSDINYLELFGKYGIAYLFDLLFGNIVKQQFLE